MSAGLRAFLAGGSICGALGVYIGASNADKVEFYKNKVGIGSSLPTPGKIGNDAEYLLSTAVACTKRCGEFAVLSTVNEEGGICSRLIQPFQLELENDDPLDPAIYFNTNLLSRKTAQMRANSKVTLTYVNAREMAYVCWEGNAVQIQDKIIAKKHWREWLRIFYPEGPDGNRFSTWVIKPQKVQVVSVTANLVSGREDWRAPEIVVTDNENHINSNRSNSNDNNYGKPNWKRVS